MAGKKKVRVRMLARWYDLADGQEASVSADRAEMLVANGFAELAKPPRAKKEAKES